MRVEDATTRHRAELEALGAALLEGTGVVPPEVRRAAAQDEGVPERFAGLVSLIHRHAYRVTDRTVQGLAEAGASDDEVFEMAVAAAYGAATRRLEAGLEALRSARGSA